MCGHYVLPWPWSCGYSHEKSAQIKKTHEWDDWARPNSDGQDRPSEQNTLQETSPSGSNQSSWENGENTVNGEVSTTNSTSRLKIPKRVSFEDSDMSENQNPDTVRYSIVAGLQVKVLEKDTNGTIRWIKVTH